jgi:hypothetical protein
MSNVSLRAILSGAALLSALPATTGAIAQMALPGAVAPAPAGSVAAPVEPGAKPKPRAAVTPVAPKLPSEETIVGRILYQDGEARGSIELQRRGGALEVARLSLVGDRLTRSGETCH